MFGPLSTLSLAATIVQFVDFGSRIIATATELHHSSEGALANNLELSTIISDLSSISNGLSVRSSGQRMHSYNKDELALMGLTSQCKELSDKLLHDLDGLNIKKAHEKCDKHSGMSIALIGSQRSQDRTESNLMGYLSGLRDYSSTLSQDNRNSEQTKAALWNKLSQQIDNGNTLAIERAILEKFKYEGMSQRLSNIVEAHNGSFDWIFDPQTTGFLQWLREGSDIYWINGNAGSGKSTLMKCLVGNDVVKTALLDWAGTKPLSMGNYLLWFVFLIDTVNEYMGDPAEIARLLKAFATSADVKIIVSSRTWTEIETFIDPIPGQLLPLHYFTRADI
ncbi:hypothetical protein BGAL_0498g00040 [Botrytis galanthina]|uniref:Nephrocystin 3-like N-terminal domain-containing protein n=1 Tax=Botrytis galanthina TaxID=278940 RepID=A0A4S8QV23_9HELO|nr:hypothetical protein BGAL_0498g00040 [Botrytis galanthina]